MAAAGELRQRGLEVDVAIGFFDPMLAAHARRLSALARAQAALFVAVLDPPGPLMERRARAELAAGQRVVHSVVIPDVSALEELLERLAPARIYREEDADAQRRDALMHHVRSREPKQ